MPRLPANTHAELTDARWWLCTAPAWPKPDAGVEGKGSAPTGRGQAGAPLGCWIMPERKAQGSGRKRLVCPSAPPQVRLKSSWATGRAAACQESVSKPPFGIYIWGVSTILLLFQWAAFAKKNHLQLFLPALAFLQQARAYCFNPLGTSRRCEAEQRLVQALASPPTWKAAPSRLKRRLAVSFSFSSSLFLSIAAAFLFFFF